MLPYIQIKNNKISKVLNTSVLGTFVLFGIMFLLIGCSSNTIEEIDQLTEKGKKLPMTSSENLVLNFSDSGKVKVQISTPLLERYTGEENEPYDLMPQGLLIEFLDSLGVVESQVKSEYAVYYPKDELLELTKNVEVSNAKGDRLNSEQLVWNSKTKKVKSDDFVKFTTQDEIIYGDGFEANQDLTDYTMNHIKGIITVEDESVQ